MASIEPAKFRAEPGPAFEEAPASEIPDRRRGGREKRRPMEDKQGAPKNFRRSGGLKLDSGFWITAALIVALPAAALVAYHATRFAGLTNTEALDFAQIGRNLAAGRGFTTYVLRPLALAHAVNPARQPDLVHGPLYPLVLALAIRIAGARDTVVSLVSGAFYLLTVPLVYVLGRQMFRQSIARTATVAFALNPVVLDYASSGLHVTLLTFLSALLFYAMLSVKRAQNPSPVGANSQPGSAPIRDSGPARNFFAAGVLMGLLYTADSLFIWIVPIVAASVIWGQPKKGRAALLFGVPFAVVALPWMVRNGMLAGNPIFGLRGAEVWMGTNDYPGNVGYRMLAGSLAPTADLFQSIIRKLLSGINQILFGLPQLQSTLVLAFFVPSLLFRLKDPAANSLRSVSVLCSALLGLGMLFFGVQVSLLLGFLPIILLFSVAYIAHVFQQARIARSGVTIACALIACATLYPLFNDLALLGRARPLHVAASARSLGQQSRAGDLCASDQPWAVAWYADRPTLWIPVGDAQMQQAKERSGSLQWLLITDQARGYSPSWEYIYDNINRWNALWLQSRLDNTDAPAPLVLEGNGQPLMDALVGFTSVEPSDDQAPDVVVARSGAGQPAGMAPDRSESDAAPPDGTAASQPAASEPAPVETPAESAP